ncbi:MAG: hypothetical protein AAF608_08720 [Pseudomonadota bacterium]
MFLTPTRQSYAVLATLVLASCGGGGGGGDSTTLAVEAPVETEVVTFVVDDITANENTKIDYDIRATTNFTQEFLFTMTGPDATFFDLINLANIGATFRPKVGLDFEDPQDANGDNVYEINITVETTTVTTSTSFTYMVTDVEGDGIVRILSVDERDRWGRTTLYPFLGPGGVSSNDQWLALSIQKFDSAQTDHIAAVVDYKSVSDDEATIAMDAIPAGRGVILTGSDFSIDPNAARGALGGSLDRIAVPVPLPSAQISALTTAYRSGDALPFDTTAVFAETLDYSAANIDLSGIRTAGVLQSTDVQSSALRVVNNDVFGSGVFNDRGETDIVTRPVIVGSGDLTMNLISNTTVSAMSTDFIDPTAENRNLTSFLTMPQEISVPAGSTNVSFDLVAIADNIIGGDGDDLVFEFRPGFAPGPDRRTGIVLIDGAAVSPDVDPSTMARGITDLSNLPDPSNRFELIIDAGDVGSIRYGGVGHFDGDDLADLVFTFDPQSNYGVEDINSESLFILPGSVIANNAAVGYIETTLDSSLFYRLRVADDDGESDVIFRAHVFTSVDADARADILVSFRGEALLISGLLFGGFIAPAPGATDVLSDIASIDVGLLRIKSDRRDLGTFAGAVGDIAAIIPQPDGNTGLALSVEYGGFLSEVTPLAQESLSAVMVVPRARIDGMLAGDEVLDLDELFPN